MTRSSGVASGNKEKVANGDYRSVTSVGERVRLARLAKGRAVQRSTPENVSSNFFFENFAARFPEKEQEEGDTK